MIPVSVAALLWPALFVVGCVPLLLYGLTVSGYSTRTRSVSIGAVVTTLGALYGLSPLRSGVRMGLTLVAFAAPLAMSVVAIEYLVVET